jgi:hypothetical protein
LDLFRIRCSHLSGNAPGELYCLLWAESDARLLAIGATLLAKVRRIHTKVTFGGFEILRIPNDTSWLMGTIFKTALAANTFGLVNNTHITIGVIDETCLCRTGSHTGWGWTLTALFYLYTMWPGFIGVLDYLNSGKLCIDYSFVH